MFNENKAKLIEKLEKIGVLRELMPMHDGYGGSIWSYEVIKPEELPEELKEEFLREGKIYN